MRKLLLALAGIAVLAAVAATGWWMGQRGAAPPLSATTPVGASAGAGSTAGRAALARSRVVALGRIRPRTRVRVAGPARPSVVVGRLLADQGQRVEAGQELAELDSVPSEEAEVEVARVELADAERDLVRARSLAAEGVSSRAALDQARSRRDRAAARLGQARAELARSHVRAPIPGVVLEVFARDGERVGSDGILELADTSSMLAVAEVTEGEIAAVRVGQRARAVSPTLPGGELAGRVVRVGGKVRQQEVVSADPVAALDARVVEVEVELDDPAAAAALTNLRVEVVIELGEAGEGGEAGVAAAPAAAPPGR
jgi:HlyD family secretion protein